MVKKVSGSVAKSGIREQIGKLFRHSDVDDDDLHDDDGDLGIWDVLWAAHNPPLWEMSRLKCEISSEP